MKLSNLTGKTFALMVASGFDEKRFISIQRGLVGAGAILKIVSREAGSTNAWNGVGWGMSYPCDKKLASALAIDFDALIVPEGQRHVEVLKKDAHALRLLRAFLRANMPILLQGAGTQLLSLVDDKRFSVEADQNGLKENLFVDKNLVMKSDLDDELSELTALNQVFKNLNKENQAA